LDQQLVTFGEFAFNVIPESHCIDWNQRDNTSPKYCSYENVLTSDCSIYPSIFFGKTCQKQRTVPLLNTLH